MRKVNDKILVVGQIPPPYGGQAVMIDNLLKGHYQDVKLYSVRMAFSKEMNEVGKLNMFKFFHLFEVIWKILYMKFANSISILYFPPTGPNRIPFYRDAIMLICVRPFFTKIIFHFHAAGISELYSKLNPISKALFRQAYFYPDVGIRLSLYSTNDCEILKAKKEFIVPYGIEDKFAQFASIRSTSPICSILFVGLLNETKGIRIVIESCGILKKRGIAFKLNVLGKFESSKFENDVKRLVHEFDLDREVSFLGVLVGDQKFSMYSNSDIFCFPTYFEAESFPVVLLEALSFGLPAVTTRWRGIPSIVEDGINGFLTEIRDPLAVAQKLEILIDDPLKRDKMGQASRQLFLEKYTINRFYKSIEAALTSS